MVVMTIKKQCGVMVVMIDDYGATMEMMEMMEMMEVMEMMMMMEMTYQ